MTNQDNKVHETLRKVYGAIAREFDTTQSNSSCCGSSENNSAGCGCGSASVQLYDDPQEVSDLPFDVTGLSLGCGDPVTIASVNPGETVLDLGSGGGIDCFLAAKQVGEDGFVIGVDMTPEMLIQANANKVKMNVHNVEFRRGQIEDLPVKDNRIDVVISNCVINLSPDKHSVFREAFRVLKPGGRISISDIVTEGNFSPEARAELDKWAECVIGAIDIDDYTALMREVGFVDVAVVSKADVSGNVKHSPGDPRVFSARILGRKSA